MPAYTESVRGGLSGPPIKDLSTRMIREIYRRTKGRLPIIGVGGIFSAVDAYQKIAAGASLVQIYTGLIYKGPSIVREINAGLLELMRQQNFNRIEDVVGKSHPRPTEAQS